MMKIIKKGNDHIRKPIVYKCHHCASVFKTDEVHTGGANHNEDMFYFVRCPVCTVMIDVEENGKPLNSKNVYKKSIWNND